MKFMNQIEALILLINEFRHLKPVIIKSRLTVAIDIRTH